MMKKICSVVLCTALFISGVLSMKPATQASAATKFTFNGSMSKEVLRNYASRAVTHAGLCVENLAEDPIFTEDLRMLRRIGAKYIGRAAYYSWGGNLSAADIEKHYKIAKEKADLVHKADSEIILQAGIFEIAYKGTVNATAIPSYVFEAFGLPVEKRNFRFTDIVFPKGTKDKNGTDNGIGCWGNDGSGVPDITQTETKMYFYYQITRYIDAGYEAFHMGQAEKMMLYRGNSYATHWDELLTKARKYAKTHARRGIALFDCHTAIDSNGIKVGDNLVFDIQGAGIVPNETKTENGALMCEISDYKKCWLSWIGRSAGGKHPLGFTIENNFTILEFDNYGGNGKPGVATKNAFYNWGFDDVTWFATQPEWHRNQFLKECDTYLKKNNLDSSGKQQYFLQPSCRRVITPGVGYYPEMTYTPGSYFSSDFMFDYAEKEKTDINYNNSKNTYTLTVKKDYRANRQSDGCPNGFNQEDTIREIFLGKNAAENPELTKVILPSGYSPDNPNAGGNETSSNKANTSSKKDTAGSTSKNNITASGGSAVTSDAKGEDVSGSETSGSELTESELAGSEQVVSNISDIKTDSDKPKGSALPWIIGSILAVLALGGGGCAYYFLYYKKNQKKS